VNNSPDITDHFFEKIRTAPCGTEASEFGLETRVLATLSAREPQALLTRWAWWLSPAFSLVLMAMATWHALSPPESQWLVADSLYGAGDYLVLAGGAL